MTANDKNKLLSELEIITIESNHLMSLAGAYQLEIGIIRNETIPKLAQRRAEIQQILEDNGIKI